jgi:hypothetical protein
VHAKNSGLHYYISGHSKEGMPMNQIRYNLALSVLFDNEQNTGEVEGFPVSILESTEGKKRMEEYACLRREIRQLMIRTSDLPREVECKFRRRLKYLRYKTNTRITGTPTFALVTIGRQTSRKRRNKLR